KRGGLGTVNRERSLASGCEAAAVGHGQAQVFVWINRSVIDPDFVVEMRTGRTTAQADVADCVTAVDLLSGDHGKVGEVPVAGADSVAVVNHNSAAVPPQEVSEGDYTICWSNYRRAEREEMSTPLWNAPSPLKGSIRSPKEPVTAPSTGHRLGAALARIQSAMVTLRFSPSVMPTVAAPVSAEFFKA